MPTYNATLEPLNPNTTSNFNGTSNVLEAVYQDGYDGCTGLYHGFVPGDPWSVGTTTTNVYGLDYVGYRAADIQTFSTGGETLPCSYTNYQQMKFYCPADGNWYSFGSYNHGNPNEQSMQITSTQLSGHRGTAYATPTTNPY
jgi:hypothetical protein